MLVGKAPTAYAFYFYYFERGYDIVYTGPKGVYTALETEPTALCPLNKSATH